MARWTARIFGYCICRAPVSFIFRKIDGLTGKPLPGAVFALRDRRKIIASAVSDMRGLVFFCDIPFGKYFLRETNAPAGYETEFREYAVKISSRGFVCINGIPSCCFCFANTPQKSCFYLSFTKIAVSQPSLIKKGSTTMATPLQGAIFVLRDSDGTVLLTATSDASGVVALGNVSPGIYTLDEIFTPDGFIPGGPYTVEVSSTGEITVDGIPLEDFEAENFPFPNLTFSKTDSGGDPLQGAVFSLDDLSGTVQRATSTVDGSVTFYGLRPGTYLLSEESPPFGYLPDPASHVVEVTEDGDITIGGLDPAGFTVVNNDGGTMTFVKIDTTPQSAVPAIDPVRSGLIPVTGTGVPESTVIVTWPGGSTNNVIVLPDNTWSVTPPEPLAVSEIVSAIQITPNHLPSGSVSAPVEQTSDSPLIDDVFVGDADLTGTGVPASTITVTWADGSSSDTLVLPDDSWSDIPNDSFVLGQIISAVQTTPGMLPSAPATVTVQQISPEPDFNTVYVGATTIGGDGIAGSTIEIHWPLGSLTTVTVGAYGTWIAAPPDTLIPSQIISATQTVPGMLISPLATTMVFGPPA